jgi:putative transposase
MRKKYPGATKVWQQNYRLVEQLFDYPPAIRKQIYTTNIVESVNAALRKVTNNKGALPNVEALTKLLYLRIQNLTKKWSHCIRDWATIRGQLDTVRPGWDGVGNE